MNTYFIAHRVGGYNKDIMTYQGYTKREVIRLYREHFNLKHKRINLIISKDFIS